MKSKQRIAFLCHPYHRGGVTRWMADAAIALSQAGHEIYFVTVSPVVPFFASEGRETLLDLLAREPHTIQVIKTPVGREFEFGTPEYRSFVYQKLLIQLPPGTPVILSDAPAVWHSATSLHEYYPVIGVLHADEDHYYNHAERYFRQVDTFVCVSDRINATTKKRVPSFDPARIYTIPCGINLPPTDFGFPKGDILQLVYVGRISDYQKRTADLMKIAAELVRRNTKFQLNIIGDGDAKVSLEQKCKDAGMQEYVRFTGWLSQDEVARCLSQSDILLLTSDFEGTPIAMMEALAAGCGVVATRVSGVEDYEFNPLSPDCLSIYAVGDIADAVNKIVHLSTIPKKIRQQAASRLAETEFSLNVCLERYLKVINTLRPRELTPPAISFSPLKSAYSGALAVARSIKVRLTRA